MKRFLALAAICATASHLLAICHKQADHADDSTKHIREVVVKSRMKFAETTPQQTLKTEQMERLGNHNVADALRFFAGIQVKDYGGIGGMKTVNIRSLGSEHLGISYDGIQLDNAQNGQIDLGQFSLDNVEEVSLYNGQQNSILQTATDFSSAALVMIRSRRPVFGNGKTYNLQIKGKASSYDTYRLSALYEQRISPWLITSISAEALSATGNYKFRYRTAAYDTTATRRNSDIKALRAEANAYLSTPSGLYGTLKLYTYHAERGIPGAIASNVWARGERQWDNNSFVQGTLQKSFGNRLTSRLVAKYAYYDTRYLNNDTTKMLIDNNYKQQELFISLSNVYELMKNWSISLSYDFKWNKLNSDIHGFVYPHRLSNLVSLATAIDLGRVRIQGSMLATFIDDNTRIGTAPEGVSKFTPAVFVSWTPVDGCPLTLRAFAKKSFRMPTFNDLYYVDVGNAKLKPETAIQYNIGAAYSKTWNNSMLTMLRLQADAYYNTVSDKIMAFPKGTQFRWTMMNLGKVHISGIDVTAEASLSPTPRLTIGARLQYTWQRAIDVTSSNTSYYKDQLPYTPEHSGSAMITVAYGNTELNYSLLYSGERYSQQENIVRNRMSAWHTSDIALTHKIRIKGSQLSISAEVNNLFNKDYDVVKNFPMPLRSYSVALKYCF